MGSGQEGLPNWRELFWTLLDKPDEGLNVAGFDNSEEDTPEESTFLPDSRQQATYRETQPTQKDFDLPGTDHCEDTSEGSKFLADSRQQATSAGQGDIELRHISQESHEMENVQVLKSYFKRLHEPAERRTATLSVSSGQEGSPEWKYLFTTILEEPDDEDLDVEGLDNSEEDTPEGSTFLPDSRQQPTSYPKTQPAQDPDLPRTDFCKAISGGSTSLPESREQATSASLDDMELLDVSPKLHVILSEDCDAVEWTFTIKTKISLPEICLLEGEDRHHFRFSLMTENRALNEQDDSDCIDPRLPGFSGRMFTCKVKFVPPSCGTFHQVVKFCLGNKHSFTKELTVDAVSERNFHRLLQARDSVESFIGKYSTEGTTVIPWRANFGSGHLYPQPSSSGFISRAVLDARINGKNYKARQHELLYMEEIAQQRLISGYNCVSTLNLYCDSQANLCAHARIPYFLSESAVEARLMLHSCNRLLLASVESNGQENRKVYEAQIFDKWKRNVLIRLSEECLKDYGLIPGMTLEVELNFQLNVYPFCEMHMAVDALDPVSLVFPEFGGTHLHRRDVDSISCDMDPRMNDVQRAAVLTITKPLDWELPPILIGGPFGTGKSFTIFQAVKIILQDPKNRVLLCTHSNSAADVYITEYLHPYVVEGREWAAPLRIYHYSKRLSTVHPDVQNYCLFSNYRKREVFAMPKAKDVRDYKIVVSNLRTAQSLMHMRLEQGFFTHIFIDDAGEALECEAIIPLGLATKQTRIILAGDWIKILPRVCTRLARECHFDVSLFQRLWSMYPEKSDFPCKFLLTENYSAHQAIVKFASEQFYGGKISSGCAQQAHETFYPLTWFRVNVDDPREGRKRIGCFSTVEVNEIVRRIQELKETWPPEWGAQDDSSIAVLTLYYHQVLLIRRTLRKNGLSQVYVGKLTSIEGMHFRALFLSTVCNSRSCCSAWRGRHFSDVSLDSTFRPDVNFLYSVLSRAQSLVAVVGDVNIKCRVPACRQIWLEFYRTCSENISIHTTPSDCRNSMVTNIRYPIYPIAQGSTAPDCAGSIITNAGYPAPEGTTAVDCSSTMIPYRGYTVTEDTTAQDCSGPLNNYTGCPIAEGTTAADCSGTMIPYAGYPNVEDTTVDYSDSVILCPGYPVAEDTSTVDRSSFMITYAGYTVAEDTRALDQSGSMIPYAGYTVVEDTRAVDHSGSMIPYAGYTVAEDTIVDHSSSMVSHAGYTVAEDTTAIDHSGSMIPYAGYPVAGGTTAVDHSGSMNPYTGYTVAEDTSVDYTGSMIPYVGFPIAEGTTILNYSGTMIAYAGYPVADDTSVVYTGSMVPYAGYPIAEGTTIANYSGTMIPYAGYTVAEDTTAVDHSGSMILYAGYPVAGGTIAVEFSGTMIPYAGYAVAEDTTTVDYSCSVTPYPGYPVAEDTTVDHSGSMIPSAGYPAAEGTTTVDHSGSMILCARYATAEDTTTVDCPGSMIPSAGYATAEDTTTVDCPGSMISSAGYATAEDTTTVDCSGSMVADAGCRVSEDSSSTLTPQINCSETVTRSGECVISMLEEKLDQTIIKLNILISSFKFDTDTAAETPSNGSFVCLGEPGEESGESTSVLRDFGISPNCEKKR